MTGVVNLIVAAPEAPGIMLRAARGNLGRDEESGALADNLGRLGEDLAFTRDFSSRFMPDRDCRLLSLASISEPRAGLGETGVILAWSDRPFGADQFHGPFMSWEHTKE